MALSTLPLFPLSLSPFIIIITIIIINNIITTTTTTADSHFKARKHICVSYPKLENFLDSTWHDLTPS